MPGLNVRSITAAHLSELLIDKNHIAAFEAFQAEALIGPANMRYVDRKDGTIDRAPIELSVADGSTARTAYVNAGDPTPKGNAKMDVLPFVCNEYRFAMPMPLNVYQSADTALRELERLFREGSGRKVKLASENELLTILRGTGTDANNTAATVVDLTGKQWNAYSDADHDPARDIEAAVLSTGGSKFYAGKNVWSALKRSPILTGSSAGSGTEFLTDAELSEKLMGLGLSEVWYAGHDFQNTKSLNVPAVLSRIHDNTAAVWGDGAIIKAVMEEFQYDTYEDQDTRQILFRALETSVIKVAYKQSIVAFTNILA